MAIHTDEQCWLSDTVDREIAVFAERQLQMRCEGDRRWKDFVRSRELPDLVRHQLARTYYGPPRRSLRENIRIRLLSGVSIGWSLVTLMGLLPMAVNPWWGWLVVVPAALLPIDG